MKIGLLIVGLFAMFSSGDVFAQQKLSTDEILAEYRKSQTTPDIDSILRWDIHLKARNVLDNLVNSGVDTLVVYSVDFPGHGYIGKPDSCANTYPTNSHFFWKKGGRYFYSESDGRCKSGTSGADEKVVRFAVNNYSKIADEFFIGAVSAGERRDGRIVLKETVVNHEPKYSILVIVKDKHSYLTFTENGLSNQSSLFLDHNKGLSSFRLFELIKTQVGRD